MTRVLKILMPEFDAMRSSYESDDLKRREDSRNAGPAADESFCPKRVSNRTEVKKSCSR
jgi:hypothetical protein